MAHGGNNHEGTDASAATSNLQDDNAAAFECSRKVEELVWRSCKAAATGGRSIDAHAEGQDVNGIQPVASAGSTVGKAAATGGRSIDAHAGERLVERVCAVARSSSTAGEAAATGGRSINAHAAGGVVKGIQLLAT